MTSNQIALRSLRVDEEFVMDLQLRGTRCDGNYRPGREYHHRELAQAQKKSVLLGNTQRSDENGRKIVMLDSYWTVPSSPVAFMLPCARYQVAGHGGGICA